MAKKSAPLHHQHMRDNFPKTTFFSSSRFSILKLAIFALIFIGMGSYFILFSHAATLSGDINGDNQVNILDLSLLLSSYSHSQAACVTNSAYTCDLNGSGSVDIF